MFGLGQSPSPFPAVPWPPRSRRRSQAEPTVFPGGASVGHSRPDTDGAWQQRSSFGNSGPDPFDPGERTRFVGSFRWFQCTWKAKSRRSYLYYLTCTTKESDIQARVASCSWTLLLLKCTTCAKKLPHYRRFDMTAERSLVTKWHPKRTYESTVLSKDSARVSVWPIGLLYWTCHKRIYFPTSLLQGFFCRRVRGHYYAVISTPMRPKPFTRSFGGRSVSNEQRPPETQWFGGLASRRP